MYLHLISEAAGFKESLPSFYAKFNGSDRSIDWFLRRHDPTFGEVARLHIAAVLLACEREDKLSGDWYQMLSEEILPRNLESLEEGKLSVISFNYDRSFERYFLNQFENLCALSPEEALTALGRIQIVHVYGQLGTLDYVSYGASEKAHTASKQIRTVRLEPEEDVQARIGKMIRDSTYINFIGFGFDEDNIHLLGPENFKGKRVYSTTHGMGARTRAKIQRDLGVRFLAKEPLEMKADQLLRVKDLFGPKIPPRNTSNRPSGANRPSGTSRPRILTRPTTFQSGWDI
ncbi:MAG TPA: hypothetical protein VK581_12105 [Chthoniobacterales bacterium]|nr:hypothetical protein [Chthoniobacterales bacterium]